MNDLPEGDGLHIELLSSCFNETTNSYKFYWLLAILDHVNESESLSINYDELSLRMLSLAWYPLDFYKLSFGRQDSFKALAHLITKHIEVDNRPSALTLFVKLRSPTNNKEINQIKREVNHTLNRWVAYRFLRPFFASELKGIKDHQINREISMLADLSKGHAPYHLEAGQIILNEKWKQYFLKQQHILKGFVKWHLLKFLQRNNPNVIGLSEKLERPSHRNLGPAKQYWQTYLNENPADCIYGGGLLDPKKISLDHFVPWSYIVHDQIWNIIPTTRSINSKKGDSLPNTILFLEKLCLLQFKALIFHIENSPNGLIEDFYSINDTTDFSNLSFEKFRDKLSLELHIHIRNARNLGFTGQFP